FLLLPENRAAHAAIQHLAECVSATRFDRLANPLFLHGPAGSGKSHLVALLVADVTRRCPDQAVRVLSAGDFEALARTPEAAEDSPRAVRQPALLVREALHPRGARRGDGVEALGRVLDYRLARALPTVCTATAGPARLGRLPAR